MKKIASLLLMLGCHGYLSAQSYTSTVEYQKVQRQAIVCDVPFPEKLVSNAIEDTMEKLGYKGKDSKGFEVFKGVKLSAFGNESLDLYFMVDRKSRKEKETSTVTLLISKGFDDFVTKETNAGLIDKAKTYLDSMRNMLAHYDLEQQIAEQEAVVQDNEKKANKLSDEAEDLQKKKKKIEKDIEDNIKDQSNQKAEIEKQRQILETLRSKRG